MAVDLFTLIAQIVNFIILLLLLRHFLFKRIVSVMDERERRIAARLREAEEKRTSAEEEKRAYREKNSAWEDERRELRSSAEAEVKENRRRWLEEARREVERNREEWVESLSRQREGFLEDLRREAGTQLCGALRRVLQDLADAELERRVAEVFIERIRGLGEAETQALRENMSGGEEPVIVASAFDMPEDRRRDIAEALRDVAGGRGEPRFTTDPDLLCGVELTAGYRKISWNVRDYVDDLERELGRMLEEGERRAGEKEPAEETEEAEEQASEEGKNTEVDRKGDDARKGGIPSEGEENQRGEGGPEAEKPSGAAEKEQAPGKNGREIAEKSGQGQEGRTDDSPEKADKRK